MIELLYYGNQIVKQFFKNIFAFETLKLDYKIYSWINL